MIRVHQVEDVEKFVANLEFSTRAKVTRLVTTLQVFGYLLKMPYARQIEKNLYELRIRGKQEIRIFYAFKNNEAYLIHAFLKKTQKTPQNELNIARKSKNLI